MSGAKVVNALRFCIHTLLSISLLLGCTSSAVLASSPSNATPASFVRRMDELITVSGAPIKLRGVNLGGMFLWELWLWGGRLFVSESEMYERLQSLVGPEQSEKFRLSIYQNYISDSDIRKISELGLNVVRVPINYRLLEDDDKPYFYKQSGWSCLDSLIASCEQHHVYVVLDLHSAAGGQSRMFTADPQKKRFLWRDEENKKRTIALWSAIASRYKNRTVIAGYDLLNEPNPEQPEECIDLYRKIIKAVREVDHNHMLIVEGTGLSTRFDDFDEPLDENMILSFHAYSFFGDAVEDMRKRASAAEQVGRRLHLPVWCGEFGENTLPNIVGSAEVLNAAQPEICGWCLWTWKQAKTKGLTGREDRVPLQIVLPLGWNELVRWLGTPHLAKRPAQTMAVSELEAFTQSVKFANNVPDPDLMNELQKLTDQKPH